MSREREDFRPILERLDTAMPGRELLTPSQVGKALGICRQTAARRYPFSDGYITKVALARCMANEGRR